MNSGDHPHQLALQRLELSPKGLLLTIRRGALARTAAMGTDDSCRQWANQPPQLPDCVLACHRAPANDQEPSSPPPCSPPSRWDETPFFRDGPDRTAASRHPIRPLVAVAVPCSPRVASPAHQTPAAGTRLRRRRPIGTLTRCCAASPPQLLRARLSALT